MIYFTSDWHLDHKNIIQYSNRPFNSIDEMNNCIIENVNAVAKPEEDDIFFLGDFAFGKNIERILDFRRRIHCESFYIIFGNHDKLLRKYADVLDHSRINVLGDYYELSTYIGTGQKQKIVLSHYAFKVWNKCHYGSYHLYGHSHGSLRDDPNSLSFDVGVDTNNFKPYSLLDVEKIMKAKTFVPIDHHGKRDFDKGKFGG